MLKIIDGKDLKIFNKIAIIEINGIQTQMTGNDLESYLKSLDPKNLKKIIIDSNPNASYGSDVHAVVNIILFQKKDNYRLAINATNGTRSNYFNNSGISYSSNFKKVRFYTNYSFEYLLKQNTAEVQQQIENVSLLNLDYTENENQKNHKTMINANFDLGSKDNIDLTLFLNYKNNDKYGVTTNDFYNRVINVGSNNSSQQLAEVWKHNVNDSVSLKIGSYQIFKKSNSTNNTITNLTNIENQNIKSKIPIYIGFIDYFNKNRWGKSSLGLRYNSITVSNNNSVFENASIYLSPFNYYEKVFASYINHSITLTNTKSITLGVRSESSFIDYTFTSFNSSSSYSNNLKYTNLLFNVNYNWITKSQWNNSLSLKKQIQRPNYSYLNPFKSVSSDVIYSSGDYNINPTKIYLTEIQAMKNQWIFIAQAGICKDFISGFYTVNNNAITQTYKNFNTVYLGAVGVEYNNSFFKKRWTTKVNFDVQGFQIDDQKYNNVISNSSLAINLATSSTIDLGKTYKLNIDTMVQPGYKDGLLKHHSTQKIDLTLSKKINQNFSFYFFFYDIFKTYYDWSNTTVPNYFYSSKSYNDECSSGITLKWNITGNRFQKRSVEQLTDDTIDRL